ncbi:hypothetical protein BCR34DRAFT_32431 [Clohesyomyces aquaticus]|uniref:SET domain-containing protein n=1 Tax=Clohesyomyces aquaticus TaxID=1231657 RepID=A0A1Y1Z8U6_9PLEO|nr:hypothetical protein BCR34DRAFT_32431 [Clohesyomyces aquaticus]
MKFQLTTLLLPSLLPHVRASPRNTCSLNLLFSPPYCPLFEQHLPPSQRYHRNVRESNRSSNTSASNTAQPEQLWTSDPFCISEFCVWTDTYFASDRGISIIATRNLAEGVAKSEGYQSARRTRTSSAESQTSPKYEVKALPGRGFGLVANHTLIRGDGVISESPVILAQHDIEDLLGEREIAVLHRVAVERLPQRSRADAAALHGYGGKGSAYDRFSANAFKVYDFAGVFPMVARINHDCRPNAHFHFDKKSFTHRIHAIRTIEPGEEITISYLSHYLTSDERAHRTTSQWGFECSCRLCHAAREDINNSDNRLSRIQSIEAFFLEERQDEITANPAMAEELIQLYKEERLGAPISRAYGYAAKQHALVGDKAKARMYANHALDAAKLWAGPWSKEVAHIYALLAGL